MYGKCPGQEGRNLTVDIFTCPKCGGEVEIFSDERSARCQKCGERVRRLAAPSCSDWCPSARECIGEEEWRKRQEQREAAT